MANSFTSEINLDIEIDPKKVDEQGDEIIAAGKMIYEGIEMISKSRQRLVNWKSEHKEKYEKKFADDIEKMNEMAAAVTSYGTVAKVVARKVTETEIEIGQNLA